MSVKRFALNRRRRRKPQLKPQTPREARTVVVAFRLRKSEAKLLKRELKEHPVAGVKSMKQFARKLTIDHALRRTVYVDPLDERIAPDSRKEVTVLPPNCRIENGRFRRSLIAFLNTGDNWRKLRLFMLLAGWPEEAVSSYNNAETDQERLLIAQEVLRQMAKRRR